MAGSPSNSTTEPSERTTLLSKDTINPTDSPLSDSINPDENANGNGYGGVRGSSKSGGSGGGSIVDQERGEIEEATLFEGNAEMAKKMHLLFPAVAIGILLSAADQTIIVTSYGRIGSDLDALNNTSWIATAYFLTLTSFQPLYGKLSDIFGRKPALLFAYTVFGLGCLFCGLARNLNELVAARAFAGIGGGGMTTVVSITFSDIIPLRQRGTWQGYLNIVFALGASGGAPLGGILSDTIGWRWAFLIQFPMTIVASIVVFFVLDLPKVEHSHWLIKLKKIDFFGAFSLVTAVFSLLVGMDRGGNVAWSDTITIVFLSISTPLFALFVFIEMRIASNPFAPGHIIFDRPLFASYLSNFFLLAAHMGVVFYVPLYFQAVDGLSATGAGLRLIPVMVCGVGGSLFGGKVMAMNGRYYWLTVGSVCISILGAIIIFLFSGLVLDFSWGIVIGLGMVMFGGGSAITTTLINVIANADPKDQAIATACTYLFRSLGSVVGVSWAATVVQQSLRTQLRAKLDSEGDADEIVKRVRQSLDFIRTLEPHTKLIVTKCYQKATNTTFGVSVGVISCGLLATFFIIEKRLSK